MPAVCLVFCNLWKHGDSELPRCFGSTFILLISHMGGFVLCSSYNLQNLGGRKISHRREINTQFRRNLTHMLKFTLFRTAFIYILSDFSAFWLDRCISALLGKDTWLIWHNMGLICCPYSKFMMYYLSPLVSWGPELEPGLLCGAILKNPAVLLKKMKNNINFDSAWGLKDWFQFSESKLIECMGVNLYSSILEVSV